MARKFNTPTGPVAHIRFRGESRDVPLASLGLKEGAREPELRRALARYLEVDAEDFADHVLERHASGNVTLRPHAVFG